MKKLLKKLTVIMSACVLATCGVSFPVGAVAETGNKEVTITFDYEADGVTMSEEYDFSPIVTKANSSVNIPEGIPEREGYYCYGWTNDNIHAYAENDAFCVNDEDVVLRPIWCMKNQTERYTVKYEVEIDNEIIDTSELLPDVKYYVGQVATVSLNSFDIYRSDAAQLGWTDGTTEFLGQEKFIIHNYDVVLTPNWKTKYKITYITGNVDRIVGMTFVETEQIETLRTDLKAAGTFSRNGFTISGWLCDADSKIYSPSSSYIMPSQDVTFTAVWSPKEYNVVFKQDSKAANNLKVKGLTDTAIITPEPTITVDGCYFAGWQYGESIYQAGTEFIIPGAIAGAGIVLQAIWSEEPPTVTEKTVFGDADESGDIDINDTVLIMQSIASPDKYKLTTQGRKNADVVDSGEGITNSDALAVQYVESKILSEEDLPITTEKLNSISG